MAIIQGDIARKLNLSVATVSRSLRNDRSIHPETRARVLEAASRMGYQVRNTAGLRRKVKEVRTEKHVKPICVLIQSDLRVADENLAREVREGMMVHRALSGITEAACELNTHAVVHYIKRQHRDIADDPAVLPSILLRDGVSGLILVHYYPPDVVRRLSDRYPCVSLHAQYPDAPCDSVAVDSMDAVAKLVDRLSRAGHERVGFLGVDRDFSWSRFRFCGYVDGLTRNSLPYESDNIVSISQLKDDWTAVENVRRRIDAGVRAWVCCNDWAGYGLMERLAEWGLAVPEDVSVTGFDDYPSSNTQLPKLTSVNTPEEFIGFAAVRALLARANHPNRPGEQILVEGSIVDGQTVAPPKQ
ncbi:MAG: LacI family DNA-binding transcriptional regulator [Phycisphaerae bacterium]|nr:LacI family DNA-binding transcriptional regulator [Phycisphaerae bacterium]